MIYKMFRIIGVGNTNHLQKYLKVILIIGMN